MTCQVSGSDPPPETLGPSRYLFELSLASAYQFLLVFTMRENLPLNLSLAGVYMPGIGMHLVQQRHSLAETARNREP